jgi:predicted transcriptional regulator
MRILTDIPDEDVARLDELARRQGRSRAAEIRDAIRSHLAEKDSSKDWIARWAGLWADRHDIPDSVEYQRVMREDRRPYKDI